MIKKDEFLKSIRGLSESDLLDKIRESKVRLKKLSFSHRVSSLSNPKIMGQLRRNVARLKTELNNKK